MMDTMDRFTINTDRSGYPLLLRWPGSTSPTQLYKFSDLSEWRNFIGNMSLNREVPQIVANKFDRARRLYFLAWIDADIIKAGELAALAALELALRDVYPAVYQQKDKKGKPKPAYIKDGLKHMREKDGLTDELIPISKKYGWTVVANLYNDKRDQTGTLVGIRNSLAHGDPFDGAPWAGLLEVVRDLIDYMYRDWPKSDCFKNAAPP